MLSPRRAAHGLLLMLAVGAFVAVPAAPAIACSCAAFTDAQARSAADAVFFGEVVQRRDTPPKGGLMSSDDPAVYVVKVSRVFKGQASATQEVVTARFGASCGLELPARGSALFFAYGADRGGIVDGNLKPGQLSSHLCSGTRSADSAPASLGKGTPPTANSQGNGGGTPAASLPGAGAGPERSGGAPLWPTAVAATVAALAGASVLAVRRTRSRRDAPGTGSLSPT